MSAITSWEVGAVGGTFNNTTHILEDPQVGDQVIAKDAGTTGRDHIVVTAEFKDGTKQVVLDTYV